jgi:type IV pilus assembly protein PilO
MAVSRDSLNFNIDLNSVFEGASAQFRGLDPKEPGQWPMLPKVGAWLGAGLVVLVGIWFLVLSPKREELDAERSLEEGLRQIYRDKLTQSVNLGELRKQKSQVEEYVNQMEKQLPGKADMEALLTDINQAAVGRGLQFELTRPGQVVVKDYYAELPISIRVSGRFHDMGTFAADVANLSRIVTLSGISMAASNAKDANGLLTMDAVARTYRYLDPAEIEQVRASAKKKPGEAK